MVIFTRELDISLKNKLQKRDKIKEAKALQILYINDKACLSLHTTLYINTNLKNLH